MDNSFIASKITIYPAQFKQVIAPLDKLTERTFDCWYSPEEIVEELNKIISAMNQLIELENKRSK